VPAEIRRHGCRSRNITESVTVTFGRTFGRNRKYAESFKIYSFGAETKTETEIRSNFSWSYVYFSELVVLCWVVHICMLHYYVRQFICYRPSVCLSSVTFVRPTQAIESFGNVSTPFGTLAICDLSKKILPRSSQRNLLFPSIPIPLEVGL